MKPSDEEQKSHVGDMLASAQKAAEYVRNVSFDEFWDNAEKRDAVAMRLVVLGEAARGVTPETAAAIPTVPFQKIAGMRNRIAHDYGQVNFRIVWQVAKQELPNVIQELEQYLSKQKAAQALAQKISQQPPPPKQGPSFRMGM